MFLGSLLLQQNAQEHFAGCLMSTSEIDWGIRIDASDEMAPPHMNF